ncbi:hypothetical protein Tco_0621418, partial [Tanacetum coccineum]
MAMYSASVVDIAVLLCFFDDQLTNPSRPVSTRKQLVSDA